MTRTEFLTARLAEDEGATPAKAAAKKVEPEDTETSRWFGHAHWVAKYGTVVDASNDDYGMITDSIDEVCVHIARWDPARVLRDVEAKRRILARFQAQSRLDLPEGVHDGRDPDEAETDEVDGGVPAGRHRVRARVRLVRPPRLRPRLGVTHRTGSGAATQVPASHNVTRP